jgi:DNA-binding beta-propeller fold protein YncE
MPKIFISYRREDSPYEAISVRDRLAAHFGEENVFFDVDSIRLGDNFRRRLGEKVGECDYLIAVIGRSWLNVCDKAGKRRLDDANDWVRVEIQAALARDIPVIAVLLHHVPMPCRDELPAGLQELADRQAMPIRPLADFRPDVDKLIRDIEQQEAERRRAAELRELEELRQREELRERDEAERLEQERQAAQNRPVETARPEPQTEVAEAHPVAEDKNLRPLVMETRRATATDPETPARPARTKAGRRWKTPGRKTASVLIVGSVAAVAAALYHFWPARDQATLTLKVVGSVAGVAFHPDGRQLADASSTSINIWDVATGQRLRSLVQHTEWMTSLAYSRDGKRLAGGSANSAKEPDGRPKYFGQIVVFDAATGETLAWWEDKAHWVTSLAFSADGAQVANGNWAGTVKVWDPAGKKEVLTIKACEERVNSVAYSPDGKHIASAGRDWKNAVSLWDVATGRRILSLQPQEHEATSVAFSPDGKQIAASWVTDYAGYLALWDALTGKRILKIAAAGPTSSVAFSPDGKRIASGSHYGSVQVWDASSGQQIATFKGNSSAVQSVAFSPDGKLVASGGFDNTVRVWDTANGQ